MLTVLAVLGVVVVLGVAALAATRDGALLVPAPPDRPDLGLPAAPMDAEDVAGLRFGMVLRGYRMAEVDEVLDRLAGELAERDRRIAELEAEAASPLRSARG